MPDLEKLYKRKPLSHGQVNGGTPLYLKGTKYTVREKEPREILKLFKPPETNGRGTVRHISPDQATREKLDKKRLKKLEKMVEKWVKKPPISPIKPGTSEYKERKI